MPLLQRILHGGRAWSPDPARDKEIQDGIKRSVFFDIQVAADIIIERARRTGNDTVDAADAGIGLLKPPYPEMFVEWDQGAISPSSTPLRYGCYLSEHVGSGVLESGRRPAFIATIVNADLMAYQVAMAVALDDDGHFADWNLLWDDDYSPDEDDDAYTRLLVHNVIMALGLINCRNVETKETGRVTVRP